MKKSKKPVLYRSVSRILPYAGVYLSEETKYSCGYTTFGKQDSLLNNFLGS